MRIVVQSIKPPAEGKKRYLITTADGQKFGVYPNQIALFHEGCAYDIETKSWQAQNGFPMTDIEKATKVQGAPPPAASAAPREPFVSGSYRPGANSALTTPDAPMSKDEQIFVQGIVQALIRSGEVGLDNTEAAVNKMRGIWKRTLGRAMIQHQIAAE